MSFSYPSFCTTDTYVASSDSRKLLRTVTLLVLIPYFATPAWSQPVLVDRDFTLEEQPARDEFSPAADAPILESILHDGQYMGTIVPKAFDEQLDVMPTSTLVAFKEYQASPVDEIAQTQSPISLSSTAIDAASTLAPSEACQTDSAAPQSSALPVANVSVMGLNVLMMGALLTFLFLVYRRRSSRIRLNTDNIPTIVTEPDQHAHAQQHTETKHLRPSSSADSRRSLFKARAPDYALSSCPPSPIYCPSPPSPVRHSPLSPTSPVSISDYGRPLTPTTALPGPTITHLPSFHPLQKKPSWIQSASLSAKQSIASLSSRVREDRW